MYKDLGVGTKGQAQIVSHQDIAGYTGTIIHHFIIEATAEHKGKDIAR